MTSKHPKRCETCESFHEERQTPRYRCSWNCCYVHPKDECLCRPSHWEAKHSASRPVLEQNPCEENGCTDIENCDEICEHMRIYSPAYVRESRQKARAEVLDEANLIFIRVVDDIAENGDANWHKCDMLDKMQSVWCEVESLRQQEGKR